MFRSINDWSSSVAVKITVLEWWIYNKIVTATASTKKEKNKSKVQYAVLFPTNPVENDFRGRSLVVHADSFLLKTGTLHNLVFYYESEPRKLLDLIASVQSEGKRDFFGTMESRAL